MRLPGELEKEANHGLVVGNAGISADVSAKGNLFQRVIFNPPTFVSGPNSLKDVGRTAFFFGKEEKADAQLDWQVTEHCYPRYRAQTVVPNGVQLSLESFAPVSAVDAEAIFLPAVFVEMDLTNPTDEEVEMPVGFVWQQGKWAFDGEISFDQQENFALCTRGTAFVSAAGDVCCEAEEMDDCLAMRATARIAAHASAHVRFLFGIYEENCRWRTKCQKLALLVGYLHTRAADLAEQVQDFIDKMPNTGDGKLSEYTRWYMQAAVLLTKSTTSGEVITMGYNELNQRDSFWTSFAHLSLWPALERDMIRTSMRWQRLDGKIPTTILPLIEREYDIDINEYFCLRIARYYERHNDLNFLRECFPAYVRSVQYLQQRDTDGDALPEQPADDFWADWKDVRGVIGRKLAPHFCLLWLATLKEGAKLAHVLGEDELAAKWDEWYARADEIINRDFALGGMWDGDHYCEIWYDGRHCEQVLIDQSVGVMYGVIPPERVELVYQALARSECEYGIRETYPYRWDEFEYPKGVYHNGGVWPYLMWMDAIGRYQTGRAADAERLVKKTGYWDLEATDHWAPNEYLHGDTGANMGFEVQGWSAALYGVITCGAFAIRHIDEHTLHIGVRVPQRDFDTLLVLPEAYGTVRVARKDGVLSVSQPAAPSLHIVCE